MCISYPGRVMSVHDDCVLVDEDGRRRRASRMLVPDLEPGDWVLVAAGAVIERLDPREAQEIIATLDAAVAVEAAAAPDVAASPRDPTQLTPAGGRS